MPGFLLYARLQKKSYGREIQETCPCCVIVIACNYSCFHAMVSYYETFVLDCKTAVLCCKTFVMRRVTQARVLRVKLR